MKPTDLAAIRDRANNATPGPWDWDDEMDYDHYVGDTPTGFYIVYPQGEDEGTLAKNDNPSDAEFIAASRTDIPALLDHIAELEAALDQKHRTLVLIRDSLRDVIAQRQTEIDKLTNPPEPPLDPLVYN